MTGDHALVLVAATVGRLAALSGRRGFARARQAGTVGRLTALVLFGVPGARRRAVAMRQFKSMRQSKSWNGLDAGARGAALQGPALNVVQLPYYRASAGAPAAPASSAPGPDSATGSRSEPAAAC